MTKEEIQAQIDILRQLVDSSPQQYLANLCFDKMYIIGKNLASAKSIKDLQREAFKAGRNYFNRNVYNGYEFATFEDYLKNLENE